MLTNFGIEYISETRCVHLQERIDSFSAIGVPVTGESPIMDANFPDSVWMMWILGRQPPLGGFLLVTSVCGSLA